MPAHRFPVFVWEDFEGFFTARLLDDDEDWQGLVGTGRTETEALHQLREYLQWSFRERPWRGVSDFGDPQVIRYRVEVRPEYRRERRIFPCDETIMLDVPCVWGRQVPQA